MFENHFRKGGRKPNGQQTGQPAQQQSSVPQTGSHQSRTNSQRGSDLIEQITKNLLVSEPFPEYLRERPVKGTPKHRETEDVNAVSESVSRNHDYLMNCFFQQGEDVWLGSHILAIIGSGSRVSAQELKLLVHRLKESKLTIQKKTLQKLRNNALRTNGIAKLARLVSGAEKGAKLTATRNALSAINQHARNRYKDRVKPALIALDRLMASKQRSGAMLAFSSLTSFWIRRLRGFKTQETDKQITIEVITKQLTMIDSKIETLQSELNLPQRNSAIARLSTSPAANRRSIDGKSAKELAALKRKTLTEILKERNANLAKFLEKHRVKGESGANLSKEFSEKRTSAVAGSSEDASSQRDYIALRDLYF